MKKDRVKGLKRILIFIVCFSSITSAEAPLNFIIRVDDIQSRNMTMLPRSIGDFGKAVAERGAKVSWAVIPHRLIESQNQDGILAEELRQSVKRGHEIVMHGYTHICPLCGSSGHEMYCATNSQSHSYEVQQQIVRDGLQILYDSLDCRPSAFVPPGHQADETTHQVLLDEDFDWFSSTGPTMTMIYDSLYNLAPHNEYTWYLLEDQYRDKLNRALADIAERGEKDGYYCLLLHDPFIRQGYRDGLVIDWTGELLDSLKARYGRRLRFMTLSQAAEALSAPTAIHADVPETRPDRFELFSNYPNPFNHITHIRFQLSQPARVNVSVFDIHGKRVALLTDARYPDGYHKLRWNAESVSSGVYYIRMTVAADGSQEARGSISKRCILIK